jgi:hypothetical protein
MCRGRRAWSVLFLEKRRNERRYKSQLQNRRDKARHYTDSIVLPSVRGGIRVDELGRRLADVALHVQKNILLRNEAKDNRKNPLVRSPVWAGRRSVRPAADANTVCSPVPTDSSLSPSVPSVPQSPSVPQADHVRASAEDA